MEDAEMDSIRPTRLGSKSLREILDEWERLWLLEQPHSGTGCRTHGGLI